MNRQTIIEVAVAAIVRQDGRVLVMQRLPGTPYAGRWEFPGGKFEAGETAEGALARELDEELGIIPTRVRPLMRIRHDYPERRVRLHCLRVDAWTGDVVAREGHALQWLAPEELSGIAMLDADRPLITALRLPARYAVTADVPAEELLAGITRLLDAGHTLVQLRAQSLGDALRDTAVRAIALCRARGATLLVNTDPATARVIGADGVHLSARELMALAARPLPEDRWVAASCHDAAELAHARRIGCDFAVLGPVERTHSHPHAEPLGWERFAALADCAGLPVYALGGLHDAHTDRAYRAHAQGIAAIRAWWAGAG